MPLLLDTDMLTILQQRSQPGYDRLQGRLAQHPPDDIYTSVISFPERVPGWMAALNRARTPARILLAYAELQALLRDFSQARLRPFDQAAQVCFADLQKQRVRIGTLDLRIASIALATGSLLLSRNLRDFRKVPGLVVEDWTQ